jgi:hypothetical protein
MSAVGSAKVEVMWFLVVAMLVILVLAGVVVLYVAFPHRGEDVPHVPWLGRLLRKGVDNVPTLDQPRPRSPRGWWAPPRLSDVDRSDVVRATIGGGLARLPPTPTPPG